VTKHAQNDGRLGLKLLERYEGTREEFRPPVSKANQDNRMIVNLFNRAGGRDLVDLHTLEVIEHYPDRSHVVPGGILGPPAETQATEVTIRASQPSAEPRSITKHDPLQRQGVPQWSDQSKEDAA
jgi:hypothetical protein